MKAVSRYRISDTERYLIYKLYKEGKTINGVARELNIDRSTAHKYLKQAGLIETDAEGASQGSKRLSAEDIEDIVTMYKEGAKVADIVKEKDVSSSTVYRHLKNNEVTGRNIPEDNIDEALELYRGNQHTLREITEETGVPRASIYYAIQKRKEAGTWEGREE